MRRSQEEGPRILSLHRATRFARYVRLVYPRTGFLGLIELVIARALRGLLSYQRAILQVTSASGELHPEFAPRLARSLDQEIVRFYADLAKLDEYGVRSFSDDELRSRLEQGQELWLFHIDGQIVHARWYRRHGLLVHGILLPLRPDERASELAVTAPRFRGSGMSRAAASHVRAVLADQGVSQLLSLIEGSNRKLVEASRRNPKRKLVATVHELCFARRRWLRVGPTTPEFDALLDQRGFPTNRWFRPDSIQPTQIPRG